MKGAYSGVAKAVGCIACSQCLYAVFERPSKALEKIAVTMDPWLVEDDPLCETRRRFAERKLELDGLESNGAGGEAARGDPASMRSWLSCRCMYRKSFKQINTQHVPLSFLSFFFSFTDLGLGDGHIGNGYGVGVT